MEGKVTVGKNSIIKPNTRIKGPVIIGKNYEIGPNVYIGPYTSIDDTVWRGRGKHNKEACNHKLYKENRRQHNWQTHSYRIFRPTTVKRIEIYSRREYPVQNLKGLLLVVMLKISYLLVALRFNLMIRHDDAL